MFCMYEQTTKNNKNSNSNKNNNECNTNNVSTIEYINYKNITSDYFSSTEFKKINTNNVNRYSLPRYYTDPRES